MFEAVGEQEDDKGARILSRAPLINRLEFSGVLEDEKLRGLLSSAQPKRACVPCHAELSTPIGRLLSSYAHEIRASWLDADCLVGTFSLAFPRCSQKSFTVASRGEARQFWCLSNSLLSVEMEK
jgi:hypothetical protein